MGIGYEFLQATPEERTIMILIFTGLLAVAGILALIEKRNNKKK
jgi:hypothetical protein